MAGFAVKMRRKAQGNVIKRLRPAEERYVRGLRGVMKGIHAVYVDFLSPRIPWIAKRDGKGVDAYTGGIDLLSVRVSVQIPAKVGPLFDKMSETVKRQNAVATQELIGIKPSDLGIDAKIKAAREANIRLVQDAQRAYADDVRAVFEDPAMFGATADTIKQALFDRGNVSDSRAELIARDQTLKLNGAITEARQTNAGITSYVWSTSGDERVRDSHAELEGQTFDWSDPPEPGHPGEDYQCRCVALPVIDEFEGI